MQPGTDPASYGTLRASARHHRAPGRPAGALRVHVLMREMLIRDRDGVPWELNYTHYRGDIHTIVAESGAG